MNISFNWLKDLIDTGLDPDETARQLTRVGLAVEGIHAHKDDFVLDVDLTSNRPDCLSHLGIARELAVITGKETRSTTIMSEIDGGSGASERVTIEDPDLCLRFTVRLIHDVKIGPSPQWLVDRLEAVGERSINNVADITNYVMLELGQPMHAFDLNKFAEHRIVVRRARAGEVITTLDEVERKVDTSMLMICDAEKPVAIGGVMGGLDSSITESTVNVLLEVAYFDRASIRSTSRKLNLATEASYRFERGVDIENLKCASDRALELICELAGGVAGEFVDVYPRKQEGPKITSSDISSAVARLTGLAVPTDECIRILNTLGVRSDSEEGTFSAPSWRHDMAIEEDLVEEVARHAGYENISDELPPAFGAGEYQPGEKAERRLRYALADLGFDEALSYSFIDKRHDDSYDLVPGLVDENVEAPYVTLSDSIIEGAVRMRPSILPGLLDAVRLNFNHQRRDVKLFEIGKVFAARNSETGLPAEVKLLSMAMTGGEIGEGRMLTTRQLDLFDAKGAMEVALEVLGIRDTEFLPFDVRHLVPGQSAAIVAGGRRVGSLGRLSAEIEQAYKFRQPVYLAEVDLSATLELRSPGPSYTPLPRFPSITRDVSFVVGRSLSYSVLRSALDEVRPEICRSISFVDVYEGKGLESGERSITLRFEYRSDERTLVEPEVEDLHRSLIDQVQSSLDIRARA